MASYTTSLRLVQPATGEYSGSWGLQVNNGLTALVDTAVAGTVTITMTAADYTLSNANGAADEARAMVLNLTGTPGAARNVICPAVSKVYIVYNNTTGGFAQTLKTSAGTGISVPNGSTAYLRCDGTNVVAALDYLGSLTVGGNATLNAGTANGVAYLNASKVLTTGSALVFDGTNLGIGTSSPGEKLAVNQGNFYAVRTGGAKVRLADQNNEVSVESLPTGVVSDMVFKTSTTERMRLDSSGNLGLGVTPSANAYGSAKTFFVSGDTTYGLLALSEESISASSQYVSLLNNAYPDGAGVYKYKISSQLATSYRQSNGTHNWFTAPSGTAGNAISFTQAMTLDASGNLGIGTSSITSRLHVVGPGQTIARLKGGSASGQSAALYIERAGSTATLAAFGDSACVLGGTVDQAVVIYADSSVPITFNQSTAERARIDASGNLLVGKTATTFSEKFAVKATGATSAPTNLSSLNGALMMVETAQGNTAYGAVGYSDGGGGGAAVVFGRGVSWDTQILFCTNPISTATSGAMTERMRIDSGGNVGIGASSPGNRLYVSGPQGSPQIRANDGNVDAYVAYSSGTGASAVNYLGTGSNHSQVFITNNVERGRFTINGDFIVGSNAIVSGTNAITFASITNGFALVNNNNAAATGYLFESFRRSSVEIGSITQNGTTAVLFNTTSDRRLKDNIVPAPSASDIIDAIEIVSHDWKAATDEHVTYGVIAQDLALVAPQAVLQGDDGDEIEKTWGVDYSKLVPMLIKEVQSLRARVAALEAA